MFDALVQFNDTAMSIAIRFGRTDFVKFLVSNKFVNPHQVGWVRFRFHLLINAIIYLLVRRIA